MTKISKIRFAVITALIAIAVGLPSVTAIANAPRKATVSFATEPVVTTIKAEAAEETTPYVNPAPIARKPASRSAKRVAIHHVNQVVYTELEQGGRPDANFVRRF